MVLCLETLYTMYQVLANIFVGRSLQCLGAHVSGYGLFTSIGLHPQLAEEYRF